MYVCILVMSLTFQSVSYFFFFFKQKTAYEMRISDWSSDVCSSDLTIECVVVRIEAIGPRLGRERRVGHGEVEGLEPAVAVDEEIGRASCRERVCQYV